MKVTIIKDSLSLSTGKRITTFELQYPRFIHAELMTHRMFSRNSASSRAIPTATLIKRMKEDPAMPVHWGKNQPGMQARAELGEYDKAECIESWLEARDIMIEYAELLNNIGLHKQIANRILEPWMNITVLVTATEYANFFAQRCHPDAQPEFQALATEMKKQYDANKPDPVACGGWHIPFDEPSESDIVRRIKIAVGRCARVSYLTHDGVRDPQADVDLYDKLRTANPPHMSPFEHVASAYMDAQSSSGNFIGWLQYRHQLFGR